MGMIQRYHQTSGLKGVWWVDRSLMRVERQAPGTLTQMIVRATKSTTASEKMARMRFHFGGR